MQHRSTMLTVIFLAAFVAGCGDQSDDQRTDSITPEDFAQARAQWPAGVSEQIDSANTAFAHEEYETALRLYRRAAELGPNISAAWFGIYMTESARGNVAAADSAMERAKQLSPGATLLHPSPTDTGRKQP